MRSTLRSIGVVAVVWMTGACGPTDLGLFPDGDSDGDSDGDGDDELTHGVIKLEMRRGESQADNPYVGTTRVRVTMTYRECLATFYADNPSWRQDGPDGGPVFGHEADGGEGWMDRLCEPGAVPSLAECTVEAIEQNADQLTVTYAITGELENRVLLFGPIPTKQTAGCLDPIARVAGDGSVYGENAGEQLWTLESFSPTEAITDQGGAIVVRAARIE